MTARNRFRRIKAISCDGDMTLWDFEKVMRHSLGYALTELRERLPGRASADLTIDKMIEIRNEVAGELKGKIFNLEEVRFHAFVRTVRFVGREDRELAAHLNSIYLKHRFEDIELYPDVLSTLDTLADRYALGLLSNGNSYPEHCGLGERFSFVVFSQGVGFEKPDERIFEVACRQAGCTPRELIHVGDSLESDVQGAKRVGAVSVWLNRERKPRESGIVPDFEICSLHELSIIFTENTKASNKPDAGAALQRT